MFGVRVFILILIKILIFIIVRKIFGLVILIIRALDLSLAKYRKLSLVYIIFSAILWRIISRLVNNFLSFSMRVQRRECVIMILKVIVLRIEVLNNLIRVDFYFISQQIFSIHFSNSRKVFIQIKLIKWMRIQIKNFSRPIILSRCSHLKKLLRLKYLLRCLRPQRIKRVLLLLVEVIIKSKSIR